MVDRRIETADGKRNKPAVKCFNTTANKERKVVDLKLMVSRVICKLNISSPARHFHSLLLVWSLYALLKKKKHTSLCVASLTTGPNKLQRCDI